MTEEIPINSKPKVYNWQKDLILEAMKKTTKPVTLPVNWDWEQAWTDYQSNLVDEDYTQV